MTIAVGANPIASGHIGLIFNRPSRQQRLPVQRAWGGPVGDIQSQIVIVPVARPHRETQVIANQRQNAPAAPCQHDTFVARNIVMVLVSHPEQMALIISMHVPSRFHEQKTVYRPESGLQCAATGNQRVGAQRLLSHPGNHIFFRHRLFGGFHCKTGGEHFRQDNHVTPDNLFHESVKMAQISRAVHPH